jgi:NhaP-type Na+/H+ or K+/H+ antiporter
MASDATLDRTPTNGAGDAGGLALTRLAAEVGDTLRAAGSGLNDAVGAARTAVPELAQTTQEIADELMRRIQAGSDQQVSAGVAMSLGLAIGLLLGRAPRFLVAATLVPVAAMSLVLIDRRLEPRAATRAS